MAVQGLHLLSFTMFCVCACVCVLFLSVSLRAPSLRLSEGAADVCVCVKRRTEEVTAE